MLMRLSLIVVALWTATVARSARPPHSSRMRPARLTIDNLSNAETWSRFNGSADAAMGWVPDAGPWLDDTHYLWPDSGNGEASWLRVDASTGDSEAAFSARALETALLDVAGMTRDEAFRIARRRPLLFNPQYTGLLLRSETTLYLYDIGASSITRLTDSREAKSEETFSPNGRLVVFAMGNNLHVTE